MVGCGCGKGEQEGRLMYESSFRSAVGGVGGRRRPVDGGDRWRLAEPGGESRAAKVGRRKSGGKSRAVEAEKLAVGGGDRRRKG